METLLWLWGWIKVIFLWMWFLAGTLSTIVIYCRVRMLNEQVTRKDASLFMLASWCPFINLLVFTIEIIPMAASMIFSPGKFKYEHLDERKKIQYNLRQQYALQYFKDMNMLETLDDYIDGKLLIGKMTGEEQDNAKKTL